MEKAAGSGNSAGNRRESPPGWCAALVAVMLCPVVQAQEAAKEPAEVLVADAGSDPLLRMQVQSLTLPNFDAQEPARPRIDFSVTPLNARGSGLGPMLGIATIGTGQPPGLGAQGRTVFDLGLRWTQRLQSQRQIDITAWRRLNSNDDAITQIQMRQPLYGARVEMNLAGGPRAGLKLDRGFVGLQLEGGARITVKRKDGIPMVYYRNSF